MTCYSFTGSTTISMTQGKKWPTIKVKLFHMRNFHIPLFVLFYFLGFKLNDAIDMILLYVKPENAKIVFYGLNSSIASFNSRQDVVSYWAKKRKDLDLTKNYIKTIIDDINRDLFSNIPAVKSGLDDPKLLEKFLKKYKQIDPDFTPIQIQQVEKAKHLAFMAARMVETTQKIRDFDYRDNWSNKRTQTGHELSEQLFIQIYGGFMDDAQKIINDKFSKYGNSDFEKGKNEINEEYVLSLIKPAKTSIRDQMISSFNSNSWGSKNSNRKENITDTLKRETTLSLQSQLTKVNTPSSRQGTSRKLRALQGSQMGRICIAETPEGENCGLVKNLALTTYVSMERKTDDIRDFIKETNNISSDSSDLFPHVFLINGKIICWSNKEIIPKIVNARRKGILPMDCCIIYNDDNNTIEYSCDCSRLCRPLLIVENNELLIDKKKLWGSSLEKLFQEGVIELVDIREEEHQEYYIAQFINDVRSKPVKILELTEKSKKLVKINDIDERTLNKLKNIYRTINSKDDLENIIDLLNTIILEHIDINKLAIFRTEHLNNKKIRNSIDILVKFYLNDMTNDIENLLDDFTLFSNLYDDIIEELYILEELKQLTEEDAYTHSEIHPVSQYGISCGLMPCASSNQAARITYQGSMGKQAANEGHELHYLRLNDALLKRMEKPTRSLWESGIARVIGFNRMPSGTTVNIAYLFDPDNMEDSTVWCKEFLEDGNLEIIKYHTYKTTLKFNKNFTEEISKPIINQPKGNTYDRYHALGEDGLPIIGKYIRKGDCVIGKVRYIKELAKTENASIFSGVGEEGFIENVFVDNTDPDLCVKVRIGILRKQIVGDKLASRYSQKGTIGKILPRALMPRIASGPNKGVVPDMIISPASTISRMTEGMIKEILCTKGALYGLERINAMTYEDIDRKYYEQILEDNGLDRYGNEIMCHPSGKLLDCKVFFGPCTYQALRHHVKDKVQLRARGNIKPISQQPTNGRAKGGGLRLGEMERDALLEHGGSAFLNERLMRVSDMTMAIFCTNCGNLAIFNANSRLENKCDCKFCPPSVAKFGTVTFTRIYLLILRMLQSIGMNCTFELKDAISPISHPTEVFLH